MPQQRSKDDNQNQQHKNNYSTYNESCFAEKNTGRFPRDELLLTHFLSLGKCLKSKLEQTPKYNAGDERIYCRANPRTTEA